MKRGIWIVLAFVFLASSAVMAANGDKKKTAAPAAKAPVAAAPAQQQLSPEDMARQELIANINGMRNAEIRVAVMQQILNEEASKLMNIQAVFCDRYKLDVDKFRKGLYIYDDKAGKFVEQVPKP
ncbi:MAG: hypothetical protein WC628_04350 [Candidatus Omnitrophota bacterium]